MPEPGVTPQPTIKKGTGPAALAQGDAADVNDLIGLVPPDNPGYQPTGEEDQFLFSPTDRPNEPFSAGLPFGPGKNATAASYQTDDDLVKQIAAQAAKDPAAPKSLKAFAARALQGQ